METKTNIERYNLLHDEVMKRLDEGEITTEQAKELNNRFFDKYIIESGSISVVKKDGSFTETNYKFRGVSVFLDVNDDDIDFNLEELQKCKSVLSKFNKIENEVFEKYLDLAIHNWDMDYVKNKNDLKKLAKLDHVDFRAYKPDKNRTYDARFTISYNSKSVNEKFFGSHMLSITLFLKNGKLTNYDSGLEG